MTSTAMTSEEPLVKDAAMSLCALGQSRSASPASPGAGGVKSFDPNPVPASREGAVQPDATQGNQSMEAAPSRSLDETGVSLHLDNRLQISDSVPMPPLSASLTGSKKSAPKKAPRPAKYNVKPKDPKRDTSVPFDEMKRLMRVYGSLKCLRNRTPVDSGKAAKPDSIKRKFYRWFPDLDNRFIRTPEGWYRPRAGHEEEMKYRESMRKGDQDTLVKKRNSKRASTKMNAPPLV
ncbi:hypothetical protein ACHAWF_008788 [Thalassiosira exigua]